MPTNEEIKGLAVKAGVGTASGTDTYAVTIPEVKAYTTGMHIYVLFTNGNTTSSTINVNGLGVKNILKVVTSTLSVGDILSASLMELAYDGTSFQLLAAPPIGYVNSVGNNLFNALNFR